MKNFLTYQVALEATRQMAGCLVVIKRKDRDLDRQLRRAMQSVVLNTAEGNRRRGQDRVHHFRIAAGSAAEVQAGLDIAEALGLPGARQRRARAGPAGQGARHALAPHRGEAQERVMWARGRSGHGCGLGLS